jgi:hypothetical protein
MAHLVLAGKMVIQICIRQFQLVYLIFKTRSLGLQHT